jgi:hypothetical protein
MTDHERLRAEIKEAADFLRSYFGPVAHDDAEGWSDMDARQVCLALEVAFEETASQALALFPVPQEAEA